MYNQEIMSRMETVSKDIQEYLDTESYLNGIPDQTVEPTPDELYAMITDMFVGELRKMGLNLDCDVNAIMEDCALHEGLLSIRECFDQKLFLDEIRGKEDYKRECDSLLQSSELDNNEKFQSLIELGKKYKIHPLSKYEEMESAISHVKANGNFISHVENCLKLSYPVSTLSAESFAAHIAIVRYVSQIVSIASEYMEKLKENNCLDDDINYKNYIDEWTKNWLNPVNAEKYMWLVNNPPTEDNKATRIKILAEHRKTSYGYPEYFRSIGVKYGINFMDIIVMLAISNIEYRNAHIEKDIFSSQSNWRTDGLVNLTGHDFERNRKHIFEILKTLFLPRCLKNENIREIINDANRVLAGYTEKLISRRRSNR